MILRRRKVFISSTTADLASYRAIAESFVHRRKCTPIMQNTFRLTYQQIQDKLRELLADCDAVICLVGGSYGSEPTEQLSSDQQLRQSYTQLEHDFARALGKPIYLLLTTVETPLDNCTAELPELKENQNRFRDRIIAGRDWEGFRDRDDLRVKLEKIEFPWERIQKWNLLVRIAILLSALLCIFVFFSFREDAFARLERQSLAGELSPPQLPPSPPSTIPVVDSLEDGKPRSFVTGPTEIVFKNESTRDVILIIFDRSSGRYKSQLVLHRNSQASIPGGIGLCQYCYFVARTPKRDYDLGWHFLYDGERQVFTLKSQDGSFALDD